MQRQLATKLRASTSPVISVTGARHTFTRGIVAPGPRSTVKHRGIFQSQQPVTLLRLVSMAATGSNGGANGASGTKPAGLVDNAWGMQNQVQKYAALTRDEGTVDVVVIGAGIAGLQTAYNLAKQGKSVAVVEARTCGSGQTGRTSAHIMQWHDDFYSHLEEKYGNKNCKLIAESMLEAINFIENIVQSEGIECNYKRLPGYLIPPEIQHKESDVKTLETELGACHRVGMMDAKMVDLGGDPKNGSVKQALLFPRSAEFHPLDYIRGLAEVLVKKYNVKLFEMSRVSRTAMSTDGVVKAETGGSVKAREAIVIATNSPISHNVAVHSRQEPWISYMLGVAVDKGSVASANWWTAEDTYKYIRLSPLDDKREILMIGGGDHLAGQSVDKYTDTWKILEVYLRQRFPQAKEVVTKWSGMVYEPADELGIYGLDPANPLNTGVAGAVAGAVKRYIATGDSGQGITGGAIAAMVITDEIVGKKNPWADLYNPSRVLTLLKPSSVMELGSETTNLVSGLGSRVALRNVEDVKGAILGSMPDLKPGEGAVFEKGVNKVAAYHDPKSGKILQHSAICTHLGCLLTWNPNETRFDCCCHGSQFTTDGKCIQGPACADLEDLGSKVVAKESVRA